MKKKKLALSKKLYLGKETITGLSNDESNKVQAGKQVAASIQACAALTDANNCATGCVCAPTVPTWGLKCGCNGNDLSVQICDQ